MIVTAQESDLTFDLECDAFLQLNGFLQYEDLSSSTLSNSDDLCVISFKYTNNHTLLWYSVININCCSSRRFLSVENALRTPGWLARLHLKILEEAPHTHLPQYIEGVGIAYGARPSQQKCTSFSMVLIARCFGCCRSPGRWIIMFERVLRTLDFPKAYRLAPSYINWYACYA
ncbi:hypothetical protein EDD16DRAFT_1555153 [Pisolithus croceorrhizus]|nr:hypothetical protein EV401DRAFT_1507881 [Pisolithus croceorrhizus]KAI6126097.1 hypothetical protein EDD16DRAFT_1555153 [Pisolithus croceorrhizus]